MISAETGHPTPKLHRRYPWKTMQVGDSFFVEEIGAAARAKLQDNLSSNAVRAVKGRRFTTKQVENGVRVWRVE